MTTSSNTPDNPAETANQAPTELPTRLDPNHKVILGVLMVSTFVVFLNETILGVALPNIMEQLNITPSTGQWLTTAYLLTMAVIIPTTGFLLERFSTKRMYIFAMSIFTVGTLVAATAFGFEMLLIGRILQASGTAIMLPLLMTTTMQLVPEHLRGRVNGNITLVLSVAPAIGPAISGLVLSFTGWRSLFWMVLPIVIVTLILGALKISNAGETRKVPLDVLSVIFSAFAFSGLVYGLSSFADAARGNAVVSPWIPLAIGSIMMVLFLTRQVRLQKKDQALLDLRTFRSSAFAKAMILMAVSMLMLFGVGIIIPIYMQFVLGVQPLVTGLIMLPGGLLMGLMGPQVGKLYDKHGPRPLLVPGAAALSVSFWIMVSFGVGTSPILVFIVYTIMSLGLAFVFTPLFALSLSSVAPQLYGHASATIGTVQQLAGAAGTALFITVMTLVMMSAHENGASDIDSIARGIQVAFLIGAVASVVVVALAAMLKRPANADEIAHELEH